MLVTDEVKAAEVVRVLSDLYSRRIMLSIVSKALPIEEISESENIPISTCYRRIHEMLVFGIVKPERTIIREDGKKFVSYRSVIKNVTIFFEGGDLKVDVILNNAQADRNSGLSPGLGSSMPETSRENPSQEKIKPLLTI